MTSWLDMEQFQSQMKAEDFAGFDSKCAPCPSDFPDGDSYWMKNFDFPGEEEARVAPLPEQVDVVIIGSGITGAAAAYRISQRDPGLRVAMVEARGLCSGATGRNGGHIARAEAFDIRHVAEKFGNEDAVRVRGLITRNRDMMLEAIDDLGIADEIDLCLTGGAAVFGSAEEREGFEKDLEFAKQLGMKCEGFISTPEEVLQVRWLCSLFIIPFYVLTGPCTILEIQHLPRSREAWCRMPRESRVDVPDEVYRRSHPPRQVADGRLHRPPVQPRHFRLSRQAVLWPRRELSRSHIKRNDSLPRRGPRHQCLRKSSSAVSHRLQGCFRLQMRGRGHPAQHRNSCRDAPSWQLWV